MIYVGIDIGSTCAKTAVMNENKEITDTFVIPTGWSSLPIWQHGMCISHRMAWSCLETLKELMRLCRLAV